MRARTERDSLKRFKDFPRKMEFCYHSEEIALVDWLEKGPETNLGSRLVCRYDDGKSCSKCSMWKRRYKTKALYYNGSFCE